MFEYDILKGRSEIAKPVINITTEREGYGMSDGGFTFKIRTQFSFIIDDSTLSSILSDIAKQGISITGYLQTKSLKTHNKCKNNFNSNFVRLVVGSHDAENSSDLLGVRNVLDCLGVEFQEKSVIQVVQIIPGIPGVINGIFGSLWCKVTVNALYYGEETRLFIDVSNICEALLILSETLIEECPKQCGPCSIF